jgi:hypothetical protein
MKALFEANNAEYGYRRIHAALVRGGEQASGELVRQLMLVRSRRVPEDVEVRLYLRAIAVGRGVLAEPGSGYDAVVDLQSHRVVGVIWIDMAEHPLVGRSGKPGPNQGPKRPDFTGPSRTSPDIRAALKCGNRT